MLSICGIRTILDFDPVKLLRLEMERAGQDRVVVEVEEGRWNLLEPFPARASMTQVLEGLYRIKSSEIADFLGPASDRGDDGLLEPRIRLTIVDEQQEEPYVLLVGDKDRVRRGYIARTNATEEVIVIEEDLVNYLLTIKDNWREPSP